MYLAVDIGGTKTLLAVFTNDGQLSNQLRFETPPKYQDFLKAFDKNFEQLGGIDFKGAVVAVPGRIDRDHGRALGYGNLKWGPAAIEQDLEGIISCPVVLENDTKLAGLSEANLIKDEFKLVLYVTISTGISDAVIMDGVLDPAMIDSEGGQIWLDYHGKRLQWEDIASGRAIVKKYGKKASEIDDQKTWAKISNDIAIGLINIIVVVQPEVVILGGGVGTNFDKFAEPLQKALKKYELPLTPIPPIKKAQRPEEAVVYGCYELIKQHNAKRTK